MDATKPSLLFFITASFSSLFLLANAVPSTRNIHIEDHHDLPSDISSDLSEFCKKTSNPLICARTIQPFFRHRAIDRLKALEVEIEATWNQTKKTVAVIKKLLAKKGNTESFKSSLDLCKEQYQNMLDSIGETQNAIAQNDVITAKFKFSAVLAFQASCEDQFNKDSFPFTQDSRSVFELGGNCLDIIADLEKDAPPQPVTLTPSPPSEFGSVIGTVS